MSEIRRAEALTDLESVCADLFNKRTARNGSGGRSM